MGKEGDTIPTWKKISHMMVQYISESDIQVTPRGNKDSYGTDFGGHGQSSWPRSC